MAKSGKSESILPPEVTAEKVKDLLIRCLGDISHAIPEETDLFILKTIIENESPSIVIQNFITYVLPFKNKVKARDQSFFLSNDNIFGPVSKGRIEHFKKLWKNGHLTESKNQIWRWFDVLITACDKIFAIFSAIFERNHP